MINKKTKASIISLAALGGGIIVYKKRQEIKRQLENIYDNISNATGITPSKVKDAFDEISLKDFQKIINTLSWLMSDTQIDITKIKYKKLAENIHAWSTLIESWIAKSQDTLIKYYIWEILGQEDLSEKIDSILHQFQEFKISLNEIKKPKTKDVFENVKYNFQLALQKEFNKKKPVKIKKLKIKKPKTTKKKPTAKKKPSKKPKKAATKKTKKKVK